MKKKSVRFMGILLVFAILLTNSAWAHSGRTDSSGGHRDNKNKSGLGSYHYHCGGYPAHLHSNGICPYAPKDTISISNAPSKMYVGDSVELSWKVTSYSGWSYVDWESSDETVVSISASGVMRAVGKGNAKITATLNNGSKTFYVSVSQRAVDKVSVQPVADIVYVGQVLRLAAEVSPANATDKSIGWTSDQEEVAIVTDDGMVIVVGEGTAKITASALDGSNKKGSISVTAAMDEEHVIDAEMIKKQLPFGYVLSVKPGSTAAKFAADYELPFKYAVPADLPLAVGSRGETVKDIQTALTNLGMLNDKIDGIFGKNTDAAIGNFCTANNVQYSGTVDFDLYVSIMTAVNAEEPAEAE